MEIGQVLETHLSLTSKMTPIDPHVLVFTLRNLLPLSVD